MEGPERSTLEERGILPVPSYEVVQHALFAASSVPELGEFRSRSEQFTGVGRLELHA